MGKQKVVAIIKLLINLHIAFMQGLQLIVFDNFVVESFYFDAKKMRKPKPDKEKFDKFMKRVTKWKNAHQYLLNYAYGVMI